MAVVYAPAFTLRCIRGAYSANTALRAQQSVTTLHGNAELALKVPSTSPSVNFFSVLAMRLPRVFPLFTSVRSTPLPRTRLVARLARWSTIPMPVPTGARPEQGKGFFTPAPDAYFGLHRVTLRVRFTRAPPPRRCMALGRGALPNWLDLAPRMTCGPARYGIQPVTDFHRRPFDPGSG
jgi:hypothetical protein